MIEDSALFATRSIEQKPGQHRELVKPLLAAMFKDPAQHKTLEISPLRRAHALGSGDWITCLRATSSPGVAPYAVFIDEGKVVNYRLAVKIDQCESETFERL